MIPDAIWVTWENQRRNRELASSFGIELFEWADIDSIGSRPRKYLVGVARTLGVLMRRRPRLVVCMNPSIVLAFLLVIARRIGGFRVFVDAHNAGLRPKEGQSDLLNRIADFILRQADLTIVSNENLRAWVEARGGRGFALPDRIPEVGEGPVRDLPGRANLLFICTYAADEPYAEVLEAARGLDPDIVVHVTGNHLNKPNIPEDLPPHVRLTGFVSEEEFVTLLNSVDAVIDLTTREDCLVCGAYESVAAGKPMVLSDTKALRRYFDAGAVYTGHSVESLRASMLQAIREKDKLATEVVELRNRRNAEWEGIRKDLLELMMDDKK